MAWINLFKRKALSDVSDVSDALSDTLEVRQDKALSDVSDVSDAISMTPSISSGGDDAQDAFERLMWCLAGYRGEGLRLHFIQRGPRPQFVLAYPKAFSASERALVDGYFFKCLDVIAERAAELARSTIKLAA